MDSITRRVQRFRERFARAIDLGSTTPRPLNIYVNNPNFNNQSGSGTIINNNQSIINVFNAGTSMGEARIIEVLHARYVPEAVYDAQLGKGCMAGTRVQVIRDIEIWIKDLKGPQIFWLVGMAGTGKSAVAWTICSRATADAKVILGGSFFCSRSTGLITQRDVRYVVPTLARILAQQSPKFSKALAEELARNPGVLHKQIGAQIEQLLYKPLLALKNSRIPIVFVIDALDECGSQSGAGGTDNNAESHRTVSEMLEALASIAKYAVKLPVKFLVTSWPETHIRDTPVSDTSFSMVMRLHTINKAQVTADIRLYISTRLSSKPQLRAHFQNEAVDMLTQLSDGLFIVAATALQYTLGSSFDAAAVRFETLLNVSRDSLSTQASGPLDRMYALILDEAAKSNQSITDELTAMMQMFGALLSTRMALSVADLASLLELPTTHLRARLSRLHAVIHIPEDDDVPGLRILHASFGDYLFSRADSHLRIPATLGHDILAYCCLQRLREMDLCFNVSRSSTSFKANSTDAPKWLAPSLIYACLHWAHHVDSSSNRSAFDTEIGLTFRPKFLFWLEVLSVLGKIGLASGLLRIANSAVNEPVVSQFLCDANAFVASSRGAITRSAPHIYVSALPFAAKDSLIYRDFASLYTSVVSVTTTGIDRHGDRIVATLLGHGDIVRSVSYSPDGCMLASGSDDGTVRIWDTRTGEETMSPLHGNGGGVNSVSFAPNGLRVASGVDSGMVHVWDVATGRLAFLPLRGHFNAVLAVVFSPDGTLLASASADKTVRLWSSETGCNICTMNGHTDRVNAIAFSSDVRLLASASADKTVRLWTPHNGEAARDPLTGIEDNILCLGFSGDGPGDWLMTGSLATGLTQVRNITTQQPTSYTVAPLSFVTSLSVSSDGTMVVFSEGSTVRSWDLRGDSKPSRTRFTGHAGLVWSVSIAPNGNFFASGSADCTARIWDARGGLESSVEPLEGHNGMVLSVTVSPDGTSIVSGSGDRSVGVWNALTGQSKFQTLQGHSALIGAVGISPNGRLIASASADRTIRLWNIHTGDSVGEPLRGHVEEVNTVAFSMDSRWLASGSNDRSVRVWDVTTGSVATFGLIQCAEKIFSVAFSPDDRYLAAAGDDGHIHFWQSGTDRSARTPLRVSSKSIECIIFSPDSTKVVSGSGDYTARVWNISDGLQVMVLFGHIDVVYSIAYSQDSQYIVSASQDKTVRIWDATTGSSLATLSGHGDLVSSVAFTPSGQSIVSGSADGTICVWDVAAALVLPSRAEHDVLGRLGAATLKDDGWLVGPLGELLLWLPEQYRGHILLPPRSIIIGSYLVKLTANNTRDDRHWGDGWADCWHKTTSLAT